MNRITQHKGLQPLTNRCYKHTFVNHVCLLTGVTTLIARFMGPTWGSSGADRTQVGPMLAAWTCYLGIYDLMCLQTFVFHGDYICALLCRPSYLPGIYSLSLFHFLFLLSILHDLNPYLIFMSPRYAKIWLFGLNIHDMNRSHLSLYIIYGNGWLHMHIYFSVTLT